ncbi:hypothetical protein L873DRAFT_1136253 [Choiromyces venosus 120613-1]|uniref:Uncharacterized protein n=1 Tax=Choiromyces venosus 120613-1 TaxID=1336337 RepID=A0A3N4JGL9_9PEZI|nr:hypothetical protein L873DRAFT_1136253 [Choiromyces venosus 120613-1]
MFIRALLKQPHLRTLVNARSSLKQRTPNPLLPWRRSLAGQFKPDSGVVRAHAEKVLVYYTGKRTLFLASLKLSTLFLSCFCLVVAAPAVGSQTSWGALGFVGVALAGTIPMIFIQYISPPYVTHAYLHLPPWACHSTDMIRRYVERLPVDARLDLVTIRLLGRPKITTVKVGELSATRKRLGCVNWEWKNPAANKPQYFFVEEAGSPSNVPAPGIMERIARAIRLQTLKKAEGNGNGSPVVGKVPNGNAH